MRWSRATSRIRVTVGPSSGSAVAYHFGSCSAGKYGPWKISCRQVTCAPSAAALPISSTCFSTASSFDMLAFAWITAARTVVMLALLSVPRRRRTGRSRELRDDLVPVRLDDRLRALDRHGIDGELVDAEPLEDAELLDALLDRPDHAEAIDDVVGDELRVLRPALPVLEVVVVVAGLDVVGQLRRQLVARVAVHQVDDVVRDERREPANLLARGRQVVGDERRRRAHDL